MSVQLAGVRRQVQLAEEWSTWQTTSQSSSVSPSSPSASSSLPPEPPSLLLSSRRAATALACGGSPWPQGLPPGTGGQRVPSGDPCTPPSQPGWAARILPTICGYTTTTTATQIPLTPEDGWDVEAVFTVRVGHRPRQVTPGVRLPGKEVSYLEGAFWFVFVCFLVCVLRPVCIVLSPAPAGVGPEEQSRLVVVVGVQVIPDYGPPPQHWGTGGAGGR